MLRRLIFDFGNTRKSSRNRPLWALGLLLMSFALLGSAEAAACGLTRGCSSSTYCSAPLSVFNQGTCLPRRTSTQSCTGLLQGTCVSGLVCDVRGECRSNPPRLGEFCGTGVPCATSDLYCTSPVAGRCASRGGSGDSCTGVGQGTCLSGLVCDVIGECRHSPPQKGEPCGALVSCASVDPISLEPLVCSAVVGGECQPPGASGDSCIGIGTGTCQTGLVCDVTGSCRHDPPLLGEPCGTGVPCSTGSGLGCSSVIGGVCEDQNLDADGYPQECGGLNEPPCTLDDQVRLTITSCKSRLEENFLLGLCVDDCGGHGLPVCATGCDPGLSAQLEDVIDNVLVCGATPVDYGESDADEATPHGPRVVFFIHGRGSSIDVFNNDPLLNALRFESTNVQKVYGVDWNARTGDLVGEDGLEERRVEISSLEGTENAPEWELVGSYGRREFTSNSMQITEIAQAVAQSIQDLEITTPITIVTHSYGAILARQLVYRHYDGLRANGHKIVEVLTIKGPHRGGLVGTPELVARDTIGVLRTGLEYQTAYACNLRLPGALFGIGGQDGCQLGLWVQWSLAKAPFGIDNRNYPQIRWIAVAGGGYRIEEAAINAVLNEERVPLDPGFEEILENQKDPDHSPYLDSDQTVSTDSALGIDLDACYPYVQAPAPNGSDGLKAKVLSESYQWGEDGDPIAISATCYHPGASQPPSPPTRAASNHDFSSSDPNGEYGLTDESAFAFNAIAVPEPGMGLGLVGGCILLLGARRRQ